MGHPAAHQTEVRRTDRQPLTAVPDLDRVRPLGSDDQAETLAFLAAQPVHTVVMTSFIIDNGIESTLNRGRFYGYRNSEGRLEGVALIGHSTLIEARSPDANRALAMTAARLDEKVHLVMSHGDNARGFWAMMAPNGRAPRLECVEALFESSLPQLVRNCEWDVTTATLGLLEQVAAAQAEVAFTECGLDPLIRDREGFLKRVARRIEQGRVFVVVDENGKLVFKADIIAEASGVVYLEGVYVAPEMRGRGIGSSCLAELNLRLLVDRADKVCLLSNVAFTQAHRMFERAGFRRTGECTTLFA
ncbi:MAG: GNAT family N-acetyltransferase [Pyrinomonadaceae bacterium]